MTLIVTAFISQLDMLIFFHDDGDRHAYIWRPVIFFHDNDVDDVVLSYATYGGTANKYDASVHKLFFS